MLDGLALLEAGHAPGARCSTGRRSRCRRCRCRAPPVAICELTPITRPQASSSGPPELPGLIGASVWMTLSIWKPLGAWIWRPRPETMPSVAVRSRPNGLPIAIAVSPTLHVRGVGERQRLGGCGIAPGRCARRRGRRRRSRRARRRRASRPAAEAHDHAVVGADDVRVGDDRAAAVDEEAGSRAGVRPDRHHRRAAAVRLPRVSHPAWPSPAPIPRREAAAGCRCPGGGRSRR